MPFVSLFNRLVNNFTPLGTSVGWIRSTCAKCHLKISTSKHKAVNRVILHKPKCVMLWKKNKTYTKQVLRDANLDPTPYAKERLRTDFAKTLLESLPIVQDDLGDSIEFQAEAILLSIPQWQAIKVMLIDLPQSSRPEQQETITQLIDSIENK